MFENFFTTKMSYDKKKLAGRFSKISSCPGKSAKVFGICVFSVLVLVVATISTVLASTRSKNALMKDKELSEYLKRPIGSVMAEIDYADGEKLVFHYLNGFFVYDMQNSKICHAINLDKLNIGYNMQGDCTLEVVVDENGGFAYLSTLGQKALIKDFDAYRIDLESGKTVKKEKPNNLKSFSGYSELVGGNAGFNGWHSDRAVIVDGKAYALTLRDNVIGALEFVVADESFDNAQYSYVFGENYMNTDAQKLERAKLYLKNGSQIAWEERVTYEINFEKLSQLMAVLDNSISSKLESISEGNFDVVFVPVTYENDSSYYIFIYDNYTFDVLSCGKLDEVGAAKAQDAIESSVHTPEISASVT